MTYRKEIEKIYKKIDSLAQRGEDSIMDFRDYVNELIDYGQYSIFDDVMYTKYNIDIKKYKSIEELKKNLFKEIRFQSKSKFQKNLNNLYKTKKVFTNGYHFYDSDTNKYLGDIQEVTSLSNTSYAIYDTQLNQVLNQGGIKLLVTLGWSSSLYSAISEYGPNLNKTITYGTYSQVIYNGGVYECISSYDWSYGNPITPTYSNYWTHSYVPTYSVIGVTNSNLVLLDKYSDAIDIMKNAN
jgi:hypothetical protein